MTTGIFLNRPGPIVLEKEWIEGVRAALPELPEARKKRYVNDFGLPEYDADILTTSKVLADFFEEAVSKSNNAKLVSNWIMGDLMRRLKEKEMEVEAVPFPAEYLAKLVTLIDKGTISGTIAKKFLTRCLIRVRTRDYC
jgi:aspartyl-tRNA(Asn)/glutamyl-tRNA(Gln) amidotransferase subunit B